MGSKWLPVALVGIVAVGVGVLLGRYFMATDAVPASVAVEIDGIYLDEPRQLEDITLVDQDGQPFSLHNLKGHWSFLYFGYTFCPDVCPTTLGELNVVQKALAEQGKADDTLYWLISVDPARDTPARLKEYMRFFNPRFQGASGERDQIDAFTKQLGVYYKINDPEPGKAYYLVDHSSTIILINPDADLQAVLTPPHTPAKVIEDFENIRARYRPRSS